jgi:phosphate transport system permease protein
MSAPGSTMLPGTVPKPTEQRRRSTRGSARRSFEEFGAPTVVALVATTALFLATPLDGAFGFVIIGALIFLAGVFVAVRRTQGRMHAFDRLAAASVVLATLAATTPLVLMVWTVLRRGLPHVSWNLVSTTMEGVDPSAPATEGGALHALTGTLTQVLYATAVCVPFGIATAIYLHEIRGRLSTIIRVLVDAMSGVPSIVAGLFVYSVWVLGPGNGFSGFSASLALAVLMLPTVARTTEEMLKLVDPSLREASFALGSSQWRTVFRVVLPTARTGIVTAVILGIARIAGETAPLLMTAFGNDRVVGPGRALHEPQSALPLFIFQQFAQDQRDRAWAAALLLITLVLALFVLARLVARPRSRRSTR